MIKKTTLAIVAALVASPLTAVLAPRTADARPGNGHSNCNQEYMYYHDGKCLDARNKPDDWLVFDFNQTPGIKMKKSNPCESLDPGLCRGKHGD
jgi:hypothetical protein